MRWDLLVFCLGIIISFSAAFSLTRTVRDVQNQSNGPKPTSVELVVDFLKKMNQSWMKKDDEVILVLGNSGVEKNTLAMLLSNASSLHSVSSGTAGSFMYENKETYTVDAVPKYVKSSVSGAAIYSFPGFNDTEGLAYDLSISYSLRKLLSHARTVKFVFAIDHGSMKQSDNQSNFLKLARRASALIKNITKYSDSIALVVTNVDNSNADDEAVKTQCLHFLNTVKGLITSQSNQSPQDQSVVDFTKIFLDDSGKIGLLRQPNAAGVALDIPLVESIIQNLEVLVYINTSFIERSTDDFGDTLSVASKSAVREYFDKIDKELKQGLQLLSAEIVAFYVQKEAETADLVQLRRLLQFGLGNETKILPIVSKDFPAQIVEMLNRLEISVSADLLHNISRNVEFLETLSEVSADDPKSVAETFSGLQTTNEYLKNSTKWYDNLLDQYNFLTTNDVQNEIEHNQYSWSAFEEKVVSGFDQSTVKEHQWTSLQRMWKQAKNNDLVVKCDGSIMKAMGQLVRVSEARQKSNCWNSATSVELLAWDTLYVDEAIDKSGRQATVTLIAPTWNIVSEVTINLSGQNGPAPEPETAENGNDVRKKGADGQVGKNGGSGGHFLGIGDVFLNSDRLTVDATGGDGGAGQNGGKGVDGKDPREPPLEGGNGLEKVWSSQGVSFTRGTKKEWKDSKYSSITYFRIPYRVEMTSGSQSPANGGGGGVGGHGGRAGNVTVIHFRDKPNFKIVNGPGKRGPNGKGGLGGRSAASKKEFAIDADYRLTKVARFRKVEPYRKPVITWEGPKEWHPSAYDGNITSTAQIPPVEVPLNFVSPVIRYKSFIRENLADNVVESELRDFVKQIDASSTINSLYVPLDFADELLGLENRYLALRFNISLLQFFESLNDRTADFENTKAPSDDDKHMLDYLRSAIYSKLCVLRKNANQDIVVNLPEYLGALEKEVEAFMKEDDKVSINNNANAFRKSVEDKIESARSLISKEILPEIDKLTKEMNERIESLLSQNLASQVSAYESGVAKSVELVELERTLAMRKSFEPLRIFSSLIAFTGPKGAAVGSVANGIHSLAMTYIDDPKTKPSRELLSPLFKESLEKMKEAYEERQALIEAQLEKTEEMTEKTFPSIPGSKYLKALKEKTQDLKGKLKALKSQSKGLLAPEYRKEMKTFLKETGKELKQGIKDGVEYAKTKDLFGKVDTMFEIYDVATSEFDKIKEDEDAIAVVAGAIESSRTEVELLEFQEHVIRDFMVSSVDGLKEKIASLNFTLKPIVETDINVWKIQHSLRDMKLEFHKLTDEFSSSRAEFAQSVDKLENALTFLADIYDRIDSYHERQQLADYMANIASGAVKFTNPEYNTAAAQLRLITKSNLLLQHYETAIHAFKQHYFPFAHNFLDTYKFPTDIELKDPPIVKGKIIEVIERLVRQSKNTRNVIEDYETHQIESRNFDFFKWDSRLVKDEMEKLLRGQNIVLSADIVKGVNFDAVRFKNMSLKFEFQDEHTQREFDREFEKYNVIMTTVGNNYYRCGSRFYYIAGNKNISIDYSVKKESGIPKERNKVYIKISQNEFFLSPYTLWEIELERNDGSGTLAGFIDKEFKLVLNGAGQYLKKFPVQYCNQYLDKYYNIDPTVTIV